VGNSRTIAAVVSAIFSYFPLCGGLDSLIPIWTCGVPPVLLNESRNAPIDTHNDVHHGPVVVAELGERRASRSWRAAPAPAHTARSWILRLHPMIVPS